jgi:hypothetical protein
VSAEIVLVHSIDKAECLLLAAALAAMRETRNSDATATVSDVDTPGECFQRNGDTELLNGTQVQLVLILTIERQEKVQTAWGILAVSERVHCPQENFGLFVVAWHYDADLWCGMLVQDVLDPPRAANIVGNELIDAKEPWYYEKASERPECEPF